MSVSWRRPSSPPAGGSGSRRQHLLTLEFGSETTRSVPSVGQHESNSLRVIFHFMVAVFLSCFSGIHCGRYVTSHGLALNCNTDMSWFGHIVPCGIEGKGVTSLSAELQRDVSVEETIPHLLDAFRDQFNCQLTDGQTPETDQDTAQHHQRRD